MAALEANLRIGATDNTGGALKAIQARLDGIAKQVEAFDKAIGSMSKMSASIDPWLSKLDRSRDAITAQRMAVAELGESLESTAGKFGAFSRSQGQLAAHVKASTAAMVVQGETALRVNQRMAAGTHVAGGRGGALGEALPFAGPEILEKAKEAAKAGATLQQAIAALTASGASPDEIAKARADAIEFSRTHAGTLESEYLTSYKTARVISPGEANEMAGLASSYIAAARNSDLSTSENDVDNALRSMDELGFKTIEQRRGFLNNLLQVQQTFGSQISPETYLATLRHAKSAMYGWSPEFREQYLPTLMASMGQNGGTAMMTALNNYIGGHMQTKEFEKLIHSGFVADSDVYYKKGHPVLRDGAKLFESDVFQSNIVQWSKDFHAEFMKRKGATEEGFTRLVTSMPQNMGGLISFILHNQQQLDRDAGTIPKAMGLKTETDQFLATNPIAALGALTTSIEQFAAAVTQPAMLKAGEGLAAMAHGVQMLAGAYSTWAAANPEAARAAGGGAMGAGAAAGGWLTWRLMSGVGRLLGFGGGAAAGVTGGAGAGGVMSLLGPIAAGAAAVGGLIYGLGPDGPLGGYYHRPTGADFPTDGDLERSRRSRLVWHSGSSSWVDDPEAAHARALSALGIPSGGGMPQHVDVSGQANVNATVRVEAGSDLLRVIDGYKQLAASMALNPTQGGHAGRMDSDAAPPPNFGVGRHL